MKVVRFMSDVEMEMYLSGSMMLNIDTHDGYKTTSVGYCFAELSEDRNADKWLLKLMAITDCEWCIEFDTDQFSTALTESKSTYTHDSDFSQKIEVREWCTTRYSLQTHPYTRIGKCPSLFRLLLGEKIRW